MARELSPEQRAVFDAIESTREHVFVTGRAGTGKSTLLDYLAWHTSKQIAIAAPTGVAALGVGGQTIHSLFRLPIGAIGDDELDQPAELVKLLAALDTLVIDEVSMVNADLLDAIDRSLRQARRRDEPFGGAQLVLFGDPYQLAPVPPQEAEERAWFADRYRSSWFFDARVWSEADLLIYELQSIHRQHEDEFKSLLTAVRHGSVTVDQGRRLNEIGLRPAPSEDIITLATTNAAVNRINIQALERLPGRTETAVARVEGDFGGRAFPADERLELKVGAQVMLLRNDAEGRWVNGSLAHVRRITRESVRVELDGEEAEVQPVAWERYRYRYDSVAKRLAKDVVAEFTQFPLRLAWAVTIHKSQGATYERAVIDLGSRAFAPGQTYVALSRLTQLEGLYLSRPLRPGDVIVDERVSEFMAGARTVPGLDAGAA